MDNGSALVAPFIGPIGQQKAAVKGKEAAAVELQWCRLRVMETGKRRRWGAVVFGGEEVEEDDTTPRG
jgi:hypothetical protein